MLPATVFVDIESSTDSPIAKYPGFLDSSRDASQSNKWLGGWLQWAIQIPNLEVLVMLTNLAMVRKWMRGSSTKSD